MDTVIICKYSAHQVSTDAVYNVLTIGNNLSCHVTVRLHKHAQDWHRRLVFQQRAGTDFLVCGYRSVAHEWSELRFHVAQIVQHSDLEKKHFRVRYYYDLNYNTVIIKCLKLFLVRYRIQKVTVLLHQDAQAMSKKRKKGKMFPITPSFGPQLYRKIWENCD